MFDPAFGAEGVRARQCKRPIHATLSFSKILTTNKTVSRRIDSHSCKYSWLFLQPLIKYNSKLILQFFLVREPPILYHIDVPFEVLGYDDEGVLFEAQNFHVLDLGLHEWDYLIVGEDHGICTVEADRHLAGEFTFHAGEFFIVGTVVPSFFFLLL